MHIKNKQVHAGIFVLKWPFGSRIVSMKTMIKCSWRTTNSL